MALNSGPFLILINPLGRKFLEEIAVDMIIGDHE